MRLDIGTVIVCCGLIGMVLVLFSWGLALARQAPRERRTWAWGNTALCFGVALYLTQGSWNPWISVILANALVIGGYHLLELSLRQFASRRTPWWIGAVLSAVFLLTFLPFTLLWDLYQVRVVVYSVLVVAVWVRVLVLLRQLPEYQAHRAIVRAFMVLSFVILLTQGARAVVAIREQGQSLLGPSQALALMLVVSVVVIVAWSLGFITLELLRSRRSLEASLATRDRMMQLIAHDLRGPLSGQVGLLDLMRNAGQCREDKGEMLELLSASAQKSYDLLENLLVWAQSQQGSLTLQPEDLSLQELLEEAVEPYKSVAHTKGLIVAIEATDALVHGDRRTLGTVFRNLVSNAVKFTPQGGRIRLSAVRSAEGCLVRVEDSGVGMAADAVRQLNAGQSLPSTTGTAEEAGSGLGLSLCREFCRLNGGSVVFLSSQAGTSVTIRLP